MTQNESNNTRRMNGFVSASRNCFLLTTVGVGVFGFGGLTTTSKSKSFIFIRLISLLIYCVIVSYKYVCCF
jgi:hypothetical protein